MAAKKDARPNRDEVTTIRDDGSHRTLYPADASGRFTRARRVSSVFLIGLYLSLPWIKIGGYPAVFLDVAHRRFHLFGFTLAFQDLWLLFFLITGLGFSLFFITSLLGRLWCGWACPQTVFLDHVYRRIERWIEGDAVKRRQFAAAPWTNSKIALVALKHIAYLAVSGTIVHLLMAYFVSLPELWHMMGDDPGEHASAFLFMAIATGILYFNFAWFREQLCIIICPYGRLQSALVDDNTLVIGYDAQRGEPRGKAAAPNFGACVDCNRCVQVCPTGIDIRQGLQIECIGCAACIDVCDEVMDKLKRPRGLIRYASFNNLMGKATRWVRPRTLVYLAFLLLGAAVATWAFSTVRPASMGITRMLGAPYYQDATSIRNQFLVRVINKASAPARFVLKVESAPEGVIVSGVDTIFEIGALGEEQKPLIVQMPLANYAGTFPLRIRLIEATGSFELVRSLKFVGPDPVFMKMLTSPNGK